MDLVSREGLFTILLNIGCPPSLFNIVKSFHTNTKATVHYDDNVSESSTIKGGVKQTCPYSNSFWDFLFYTVKSRFLLKNCRSLIAYKIWRTPIQSCTPESKIKGKKDHHTRSIFANNAHPNNNNRNSLCIRLADTIDSVFFSVLRFWPHH